MSSVFGLLESICGTCVTQLTHALFVIATMWRMPTCLNQSGWRPCPDRLFPDGVCFFWTRTRTSFDDKQFAIRCRQSVSFPSRGSRDAAAGVARSMGRPLKAIQVFCCFYLQYAGSCTPLEEYINDASYINDELFVHFPVVQSLQHIVIKPLYHSCDNNLAILIEPLHVVDYGLRVDPIAVPCASRILKCWKMKNTICRPISCIPMPDVCLGNKFSARATSRESRYLCT